MIIVLRAGTPKDATVQPCHSARKSNELPSGPGVRRDDELRRVGIGDVLAA